LGVGIKSNTPSMVVLANFGSQSFPDYKVGLPSGGRWSVLLRVIISTPLTLEMSPRSIFRLERLAGDLHKFNDCGARSLCSYRFLAINDREARLERATCCRAVLRFLSN